MDKAFIKRATQVTSFNFVPDDFTSTRYKQEIQFLFKMHFFPKFDLSNTMKGVNIQRLNSAINKLRSENYGLFQKMHFYNLKGIGPGEVTLFFLIDDAQLGGSTSGGVDLVVGPKKYEVKAVDIDASGRYASNFKLGGTFDVSDIQAELFRLKKVVGAGGEGVNQTALQAIEKKFPDELAKIKSEFVDRSYENYFKNHDIVFINNKKSTSVLGNIVTIKRVKKEDIALERITSGVIKPRVKL